MLILESYNKMNWSKSWLNHLRVCFCYCYAFLNSLGGGGTTSGTVGLARQASVPAISEYVSSAGLNTSGTSNVAPYANTFSVSNSITPGFPVQVRKFEAERFDMF